MRISKSALAQLTAVILLAFGVGLASAAGYYVVVPMKGKLAGVPVTPSPTITVALDSFSLPSAELSANYSFDLNSLLRVAGDSAFSPAGVAWQVSAGSLPAGLSIAQGVVAGTPTTLQTSSFEVSAQYKTKSAAQTYQIAVNGNLPPALGAWPSITRVASAGPFDLVPPSSSSSGNWTYESSDPAVASVSGARVTPKTAGVVTLTATQGASGQFKSATTATQINLTAGTKVLGWQFERALGAPTLDDFAHESGPANSILGPIALNAGGVVGNYAQFTNAYVSLTSPKLALGAQDFSIEWWQKGSANWAEFTLGTPGSTGAVALSSYGVYTAEGVSWGANVSATQYLKPDSAVWSHIAIVRDSGYLRVFVNGIHKSASPISGTLRADTTLYFGKYQSAFTGQLDQVRVIVGDTPYKGTASFVPAPNLN